MALVDNKKTPPKSLADISGKRFGSLVAQYPVFDGTRWRWHCVCDCGNTKDVIPPDLKRGMVKSCGCYRREFRKVDLTGLRFGRLTVLNVAKDDMKHHGQRWLCQCDCGKKIITRGDGLQSGHTKSCGCDNKRRTTHNESNTKLYSVWVEMKQRCENPNSDAYKYYGGRGIKVCDEWQDFEPFYKWAMENGYSTGLTIDRIDNNGGYSPSNCRWTTRLFQMSNRRNTVFLEYAGMRHTIREWCDITGKSYKKVYAEYQRGIPLEKNVRLKNTEWL